MSENRNNNANRIRKLKGFQLIFGEKIDVQTPEGTKQKFTRSMLSISYIENNGGHLSITFNSWKKKNPESTSNSTPGTSSRLATYGPLVVPKEEPFDGLIPKEEPFEGIIPKKEPFDGIIPKEEPFDGIIPKEEPVEGIIPKEEPFEGIIPKEEPVDDFLPQGEYPGPSNGYTPSVDLKHQREPLDMTGPQFRCPSPQVEPPMQLKTRLSFSSRKASSPYSRKQQRDSKHSQTNGPKSP